MLDYVEAASHPQNAARGALTPAGPFTHPRPAPVFDGDYREPDTTILDPDGGRTRVEAILQEEPR